MRLWSIHPKYLDKMGLVALWREGLLARAVIEGKTKGYTRHPQLERFLQCSNPREMLDAYLYEVLLESKNRGYHFDESKISPPKTHTPLFIHSGQIAFEKTHLLHKLQKRDSQREKDLAGVEFCANPIFTIVPGEKESWERG